MHHAAAVACCSRFAIAVCVLRLLRTANLLHIEMPPGMLDMHVKVVVSASVSTLLGGYAVCSRNVQCTFCSWAGASGKCVWQLRVAVDQCNMVVCNLHTH